MLSFSSSEFAKTFLLYRPDVTSGKTSASDAGGMGFEIRADQISYTLSTTRHCCKISCSGID